MEEVAADDAVAGLEVEIGEEEIERNVATFGEIGGVGLMGPRAYVGGWGGFGTRATRPRRGGAPVANGR